MLAIQMCKEEPKVLPLRANRTVLEWPAEAAKTDGKDKAICQLRQRTNNPCLRALMWHLKQRLTSMTRSRGDGTTRVCRHVKEKTSYTQRSVGVLEPTHCE